MRLTSLPYQNDSTAPACHTHPVIHSFPVEYDLHRPRATLQRLRESHSASFSACTLSIQCRRTASQRPRYHQILGHFQTQCPHFLRLWSSLWLLSSPPFTSLLPPPRCPMCLPEGRARLPGMCPLVQQHLKVGCATLFLSSSWLCCIPYGHITAAASLFGVFWA